MNEIDKFLSVILKIMIICEAAIKIMVIIKLLLIENSKSNLGLLTAN